MNVILKLTTCNYLCVKTFGGKDSRYLSSFSSIAIESVAKHWISENKDYISYFPLHIGVVKLVRRRGVCNFPEVSFKRTSLTTPFCWLECGLNGLNWSSHLGQWGEWAWESRTTWRRNTIFPGIIYNHVHPEPLPRISHKKN